MQRPMVVCVTVIHFHFRSMLCMACMRNWLNSWTKIRLKAEEKQNYVYLEWLCYKVSQLKLIPAKLAG